MLLPRVHQHDSAQTHPTRNLGCLIAKLFNPTVNKAVNVKFLDLSFLIPAPALLSSSVPCFLKVSQFFRVARTGMMAL